MAEKNGFRWLMDAADAEPMEVRSRTAWQGQKMRDLNGTGAAYRKPAA